MTTPADPNRPVNPNRQADNQPDDKDVPPFKNTEASNNINDESYEKWNKMFDGKLTPEAYGKMKQNLLNQISAEISRAKDESKKMMERARKSMEGEY